MKRVLIVEDDDAIRKALVDDFTFEGFCVESAVMGNEGLKKAFDPDIDIILLDVMLPEIDGFEICKELRKNGVETPIIMLTAKSQEIDKILGLEFGADDYITKPYSSRELRARVKPFFEEEILKKEMQMKANSNLAILKLTSENLPVIEKRRV